MEIKKSLKSIGYIMIALLTAIIAMTALTFGASAAELQSGDYYYTLDSDENATITQYIGEAAEVTIPETIQGHPVVGIGENLFNGNTTITSVTIPESVTSIGASAFKGCTVLANVNIPANVTAINDSTFYGCTKLADIKLPAKLTSIGSDAFSTSGLKTLSLPDSITYIGFAAFYNCDKLTEVTVFDTGLDDEDAVISWGTRGGIVEGTKYDNIAFASCEELTSVTLPKYAVNVPKYCFSECPALTSITLNNKLTSIDYGAFNVCTALPSITIPANVTTIGDIAFYGCTKLAEISLPAKLTSIGSEAFSTSGLKTIALPESLTYIGFAAFCNCDKLTEVTTFETGLGDEDTVLSWGTRGGIIEGTKYDNIAFADCEQLTRVMLPKYAVTVPRYAFSGCTALKSMILPEMIKTIDAYAYNGCTELRAVLLPATVTKISANAFAGCTNYKNTYSMGTASNWENNVTVEASGNAEFSASAKHFDAINLYNFVNRLYNILLSRNAETAGVEDWINRLISGTSTSAEIVYGIGASPEFNNKGYSYDVVVEKMYEAMLDRPSDEGGKANWINCLNSGMTVTGIINGFSGSQEFANICAEYGIQAGAITTCEARDKNNGLTLFVSRMYTKALGRDYDVAGLNDWTNRYLTGEAKVSDIAFGFIFSPEFVGKNLSNSDYVDTLYRTFFNREPDEGGKSNWMNQLASGTAREDVLNGFVGSQECINLVATFGI